MKVGLGARWIRRGNRQSQKGMLQTQPVLSKYRQRDRFRVRGMVIMVLLLGVVNERSRDLMSADEGGRWNQQRC